MVKMLVSFRATLIEFFLMLALVGLVGGCAWRATPKECKVACDNVAHIGTRELDRQIKRAKDLRGAGKGGQEMARNMASNIIHTIKDECFKQCKQKGTRRVASCLAASKSVDDLAKCH